MNLKKMERYLPVHFLGPGLRLIKKKLPGRGLTKLEKNCSRRLGSYLCGNLSPNAFLPSTVLAFAL